MACVLEGFVKLPFDIVAVLLFLLAALDLRVDHFLPILWSMEVVEAVTSDGRVCCIAEASGFSRACTTRSDSSFLNLLSVCSI